MKMKTLVAAVALLGLMSLLAAAAVDIEVGVASGPSLSLAAQWEILPNLSLVTSMGVSFGGGGQTGSATLQTASYALGIELRYAIPLPWKGIRPYVGLGALLQLGGGGGTQLFVSSSAGLRVNVHRNIYLFGEATSLASLSSTVDWAWRLKIGAGFCLRF
jgi:hypothetical protein